MKISPAQGTARRAKTGSGMNQKDNRLQGQSATPNLDVMLENFTQWDYLIKEKAMEENYHTSPVEVALRIWYHYKFIGRCALLDVKILLLLAGFDQ